MIEIDQIVIDNVNPLGSNGQMLNGCYFAPSPTSGTYAFFNQKGELLVDGLTNGAQFTFTLNEIDWTVRGLAISASHASGVWSNSHGSGNFEGYAGAIVITGATGPTGPLLEGCYFVPSEPTGDVFAFFNQGNELLAQTVTTGSSFSFPLADLTWTVTIDSIHATTISGTWTNNSGDASEPGEFEETGTFQAQAGGGNVDGIASSVSA